MDQKKAFSNGRSAAARLPVDAGIRPGDRITVTVIGPGKVLIERGAELPEYSHFLPKRSKSGGNVTSEIVAKLLEDAGL
ncbi:MAG TPA: hypothetical protein VHP62_11600 [Usitatibacter sp.]|jgi:hypothetical protein|nr:hypothetical protein [Usitatibacter sp.]